MGTCLARFNRTLTADYPRADTLSPDTGNRKSEGAGARACRRLRKESRDKGIPAARPVRNATGLIRDGLAAVRDSAGHCRHSPLTPEEARMRSSALIPIAVLAFAAACSDTATDPTSVGRPLFSVSAGTFGNVTTLNAGGTPSGGHIRSGGPVFCVVASDLSITCSGSASY